MEKQWYALAVQPRKERFVENQLAATGYQVVSPRFEKVVRHARRKSMSFAPLFPGYIFVRLNLATQSWRGVNWIPGSIGLICFDNRPTPVGREFVERYLHSIDALGVPRFEEKLKLGDKVRTIGGIFDRSLGEVVGFSDEYRVQILMDALNRKVSISVPKSSVLAH